MMKKKEDLFAEFTSVSAKQWKQKIQFDLKGEEYKTLLTHTLEGITIKPFYHSDNYRQLDVSKKNESFSICQSIFIHDDDKANFLAIDALKRGADAIQFIANKKFDINTVLNNIKGKKLFFKLSFLNKEFIHDILDTNSLNEIYLNIDLIGNLASTGNWFFSNKKDHKILTSILQANHKKTAVLGVDVSTYQNAGANSVQQVACALSHANEYLNFIQENNISGIKTINFNFTVGNNYYFEIAKLRAFKYLWKKLNEQYAFKIDAHIFSKPTIRNKTIYDYNVNMLRTNSECMSAILGGSDVVCNLAYDIVFHKKNEFGERIARNQLIILKEESKIKNAEWVDGSYYIEDLTFEIADKALAIFKNIESKGGFIKQLFSGTIQRKIGEMATKEQELFDAGALTLLGTNKYPNEDEKMKDNIEIYPFLKTRKKKTEIIPVLPKRLAEKTEFNRLESEK